ncbi:MAG: hypothetical protein HYZ58_04035 [Acidobacteria bacterium]|nr:hypothetical protein [Acidobacteriota bacterium]MBI3262305.1 hypothetical protein [Acidobacteriota bacterium]
MSAAYAPYTIGVFLHRNQHNNRLFRLWETVLAHRPHGRAHYTKKP